MRSSPSAVASPNSSTTVSRAFTLTQPQAPRASPVNHCFHLICSQPSSTHSHLKKTNTNKINKLIRKKQPKTVVIARKARFLNAVGPFRQLASPHVSISPLFLSPHTVKHKTRNKTLSHHPNSES